MKKTATASSARPPQRVRLRPPHPRVFEGVCERIRRDLASGVLRPGDKLPPERDMAERLGVGRGAVREALRTLETSGVLELRKGVAGGAFVRAMSAQGLTTSVQDQIFLGHVPIKQLTEVRANLLGLTVELACLRGKVAEFDRIEANIDLTEALADGGDHEALMEATNAFYDLIALAAHNSILSTFVGSFAGVMRSIFLHLRGRLPKKLIGARRRIAAHIRARDAANAVKELQRHLSEMEVYVVSHSVESFRKHLIE